MRDDPNACMIFAAGFGTRMAPLTMDRPKPLISVAGKPLLQHALDPALEAGLKPIIINAHHMSDQIEAALDGFPATMRVERPRILETGGGLKAALPELPGNSVFTMNSDAVWAGPNPYQVLRDLWNTAQMDALVLCVPKPHAIGREDAGDFSVAAEGRVDRGPGYFYTGAQIVKSALVAAHPEEVFSLNVIWDKLIAKGTLFAAIYPGKWCDVGRPSSIPLAEAMVNV